MASEGPDLPAPGLCRVRFQGGPLSGAVLDLPEELADSEPGRLVVTDGGAVFDRVRSRRVTAARIVSLPRRLQARITLPRSPLLSVADDGPIAAR